MREKLLTVMQASEILGITPKTLYMWKWKKKNLPFVKVGRSLRISEQDLIKFIIERKSDITTKAKPE